jgi:hypothetical protein
MLNLGIFPVVLSFCGTEDIEPEKIRNERRKKWRKRWLNMEMRTYSVRIIWVL